MCFFLQSHIRTVFCIMMQAPVRYRILYFTGGGKEAELGVEGGRGGGGGGDKESDCSKKHR